MEIRGLELGLLAKAYIFIKDWNHQFSGPRSRFHKCSEGVNHRSDYSFEFKMSHHTGEPKLQEVNIFVL